MAIKRREKPAEPINFRKRRLSLSAMDDSDVETIWVGVITLEMVFAEVLGVCFWVTDFL